MTYIIHHNKATPFCRKQDTSKEILGKDISRESKMDLNVSTVMSENPQKCHVLRESNRTKWIAVVTITLSP